MAKKKYVALHTVYYADGGEQKKAEARNPETKVSGLFSAEFSEKQEQELLALGAIRPATKADADDAASPLDHDGDNRAGGSIDELDQMKVEDLKVLAEKEQIDLGDAKKRDEIIAAIRAARENLL